MNTIISKEKLEELLKSKDMEVRELAENIILKNFDTDFNVYVYKNLDKERIEISLDYINYLFYDYYTTKSIKEFLKIVVLCPKYSKLCKDTISAIFEYNDRIRNK